MPVRTACELLTTDRGRPPDADLRKALTAWSFNLRTSESGQPSAEVARALTWLERNTRTVGDLAEPAVVRAVLDALALRVDGSAAAPGTIQRARGVLVNVAEYAVERKLLPRGRGPAGGWTDSGRRREERQLKHRAKGETRIVPCPPALTALLHEHLSEHGTASDGRLFRGVRGGELAESTYCRAWRKARVQALTAAEVTSPLAGRPYDLRHAAVSTWLNAGVPSTQVAEWAGHSLAVLLQIYAKCLVGQEEAARRRIDAVLGGRDA